MTSGGLSNDEIGKLLAEAGIDDPTPKAPPGTYIAVNKRTRLFNALKARQDHDRSSSAVLRFIEIAMAPIRYAEQGPLFDERRGALNERLLHIGIEVDETGKLNTVEKAATVSEARQRPRRLRGDLEERGVHPKVLAACDAEIADENYFHIVLEAAKSLADEIRQKAGLDADGTTLIGGIRLREGKPSALGLELIGDDHRSLGAHGSHPSLPWRRRRLSQPDRS
jgi:hypothetical protein